MSNPDYFSFDPDWEAYASKNGLPIPSNKIPSRGPITFSEINHVAARAYQISSDKEWSAAHPLKSVGYKSQLIKVTVRDGAQISVKISCPHESRTLMDNANLPVLFVTHGGGWVSGSHISEEACLLRSLYEHFNLITISVEYRLFPDSEFPVWINDAWDVLERLLSFSEEFVTGLNVRCDLNKLILMGSSSGAAISAVLAQSCRDKDVKVMGVVLHVPVLCDYRHFPSGTGGHSNSYLQCTETFLSSCQMASLWNLVLPSPTAGKDSLASPLLGNLERLPPHLISIAGRDSLRDEGIAYARKLGEAGSAVTLNVYGGVPHNFVQYDELQCTLKFREDLKSGLEKLFTVGT